MARFCIVTVVPGNISRVQKPNKCHHHKQNTGCFKLTHSFPFPFLAFFFFCGRRAVVDAVCIVGIPWGVSLDVVTFLSLCHNELPPPEYLFLGIPGRWNIYSVNRNCRSERSFPTKDHIHSVFINYRYTCAPLIIESNWSGNYFLMLLIGKRNKFQEQLGSDYESDVTEQESRCIVVRLSCCSWDSL